MATKAILLGVGLLLAGLAFTVPASADTCVGDPNTGCGSCGTSDALYVHVRTDQLTSSCVVCTACGFVPDAIKP